MGHREDKVNRYIRERVLQARREANETQEDLARVLQKTRVAISDLERGRVDVSASSLAIIAAHYGKPISYFYPPAVSVQGELTPLEQELLSNLAALPDQQRYIALEYVKQQVTMSEKAKQREIDDQLAASKTDRQ